MRHAYIFFATAKRGWRVGKPSFWIRALSLSPIAHCAVGFGDTVLDPRIEGNFFYDLAKFTKRYPTLHTVVRVPFTHAIDLRVFPDPGPRRPWRPTLRRWLTLGRGGKGAWADDCVCSALECLLAGGVPVPETITTAAGLRRWLIRQGYPHVESARGRAGARSAWRHLFID